MDIGMIGLGRMGSNLSRRLLRGGHRVVAYDLDRFQVDALAEEGAVAGESLSDVADQLEAPRAVWVMVPAAAVGTVVKDLAEALSPILVSYREYVSEEVCESGENEEPGSDRAQYPTAPPLDPRGLSFDPFDGLVLCTGHAECGAKYKPDKDDGGDHERPECGSEASHR